MTHTIHHNGQPLVYRKTGDGKPVILLHGFAEDGEIWQHQADHLQHNFQLIIPDLPGSGNSGRPNDLSMEAMADAVKAIIDEELIEQALIIGHSMGGYITLAFAERYPGSLKAFGLFHSTAYADSDEKKTARKKNIDFIHKHGTSDFLKQSTAGLFSEEFKSGHPEVIRELIEKYNTLDPLSLAAYQAAMMMRPDRTAVLKTFTGPVLFIIGKHDTAVPFADSLELCHIPAQAHIHILEATGHMGMLEETEKSNAALHEFIAAVMESDHPRIG